MDVMGASNVEFDKKELAKLEKLTDDEGLIERSEFIEYAKKSSAVKEYTEKCCGGPKKISTSNVNVDKAELAFKVKLRKYLPTRPNWDGFSSKIFTNIKRMECLNKCRNLIL